MNETFVFTFYLSFYVFVAGENLGHLSPSCGFKFLVHEFALKGFAGVCRWRKE